MSNPIKVISLERSIDRRNAFREYNSHINFEFFDAVDGAKLTDEFFATSTLFEKELPYTVGAYGCVLSHLALWEEAIKLNKTLTVAEDDAIFRFDFEEQSFELINSLSPDWDIIVWGWNFDSILSLHIMPNISPAVVLFGQEQLRESIVNFQILQQKPSMFRLDKCFGTPAYSISPAGAKRFKALCFPVKNFKVYYPVINKELPNEGVDSAMNRIYRLTNSYCCFPPLAVTKNEHAFSTVQNIAQSQ